MAEVEEDAPPGVPEWVVTYGDMMSLLLTFFIMLVSLSEMKQDADIRAMLDSVRESFGPTSPIVSGVPGSSLMKTSMFKFKHSSGIRSEGGVKKASREDDGPSGAEKTVRRVNHGMVVTLGGPTMFERFSAELSPELKQSIEILKEVVRDRPNKIVIRGHASPEPLPPDSEFQDQFELSYARAIAVSEYMIELGIERERMIVSAAGDTEPRLLTRDPTDQRLNRRVDVFLIDSYTTRR